MIYHIEFDLNLLPIIIQFVGIIIAYIIINIIKNIKNKREERKNAAMFFEWKGGHYNKLYWKLVDGHIEEIK